MHDMHPLSVILSRPALGVAFVVALGLGPCAQVDPDDDLRDRIILKNGKEIACRIVDARGPEEVLYVAGSRSVRDQDFAKVARLDLHRDRLAAWLEARKKVARDDLAAQWALVAAAEAQRLDGLARLQAWHVLILAGDQGKDHDEAHAFLGHTSQRGKWLARADGGRAVEVATLLGAQKSPRDVFADDWVVTSEAPLRQIVALLFDLETAYVTFADELGDALHMREVTTPLRVFVRPTPEDRLPKLNSKNPLPYVQPAMPRSGMDTEFGVRTFYVRDEVRPVLIFDMAVEALLNETLRTEKSGDLAWRVPDPDRFAPWLEIGLGRWFGSRAEGDPGYVTFAPAKLAESDAMLTISYETTDPENLIGRRLMHFHEPNPERILHWAEVASFVAWMMDPANDVPGGKGKLREKLLAYTREIFTTGKQNSSSTFDDVFGVEIERFERPWLEWVARQAGRELPRCRQRIPGRRLSDYGVLPRGLGWVSW